MLARGRTYNTRNVHIYWKMGLMNRLSIIPVNPAQIYRIPCSVCVCAVADTTKIPICRLLAVGYCVLREVIHYVISTLDSPLINH